jgi:hypothetical protein
LSPLGVSNTPLEILILLTQMKLLILILTITPFYIKNKATISSCYRVKLTLLFPWFKRIKWQSQLSPLTIPHLVNA